jgi:SAM-dependent methyltransferase
MRWYCKKKMYHQLATLSTDRIVLDLGCGGGSFHYETCPARIIAMDVPSDRRPAIRTDRVAYIHANAVSIPLADKSADVVVSHHTLEHFADYKVVLSEIRRVLRTDGWLWIAVPNGYGLDDCLYRWVFSGGGHVNRFRRDELVAEVQQLTQLRLLAECSLFSGFVYLKKPTDRDLQHFPASARPLAKMPDGFSDFGTLALNGATRIADRMFGSRLSQYGWGFIFSNAGMTPSVLPSYFNVCRNCGSGLSYRLLNGRTILGVGIYHCPNCGVPNVCVVPPNSCE